MKRMACALTVGLVAAAVWWYAPRAAPRHDLQVLWVREFPERGAVLAAPAVDDSRLYVAIVRDRGLAAGGAVVALDRATGKTAWSFDDEGAMARTACPPRLTGGRVYVGEGLHEARRATFYCLDANAGHKLWEFAADGHIEGGAHVIDGRIVFGAGDAGAYALDTDGRLAWRFRDPVHIDTPPVAHGGIIVVSSGVSRRSALPGIFALDAASGEKRWQVRTDKSAWGGPVVADGVVACGLGHHKPGIEAGAGGAVLALDLADGRELWRTATPAAVVAMPATDGRHVFAADMLGDVTALDLRSGRVVWSRSLNAPVVAGLVVVGGTVVAADKSGRVVGLSATDGKELWEFDAAKRAQLPTVVTATPVTASDGAGRRIMYLGCEVDTGEGKAAVVYAVCLP